MYQKIVINLPCNKQITNMTIKIKVINQITGHVEIDSQIEVASTWETLSENHKVFREAFPDCQVNFSALGDNSFIFSPALNMERDEQAYSDGLISWEQYCNKWFNGALSGCNEDDDLATLERYAAEDWASRDSICH